MATYGESGQDTVREAAKTRLQRQNKLAAGRGRAFGPEPGRGNNVYSKAGSNPLLRMIGRMPKGS